MRILAESGKGASGDLSTFTENASGQEWISQQLAASAETICHYALNRLSSGKLDPLSLALRQQAQSPNYL